MVTFMVKIFGQNRPDQTKEEQTMGRHGENIRKREDGRWEARYQRLDRSRGKKLYHSVYGSTYEEAKKKRDDAIRMIEEKLYHVPEQAGGSEDKPCMQLLFSQAASEWLEEVAVTRKYSTYVKYRNVYRIHMEEILGPLQLSGRPNQQIQEKIFDHLSREDLSDSIRKSICNVSRQILEFARRRYAVHIPVMKLPAVKQGRKSVDTFSKAEQSRILSCIYNGLDTFKIAILLCLYTGIRLGELCALKWTDFDFRDRTMTVNRTVQRIAVKGHMTRTILMETDPKSVSAKRTIPLTEEMITLLKEFRDEGEYVFGGNKPLEPRTMQYRLKRILKKAEVDDRNFHILRHTFATNCVESSMDIKTLSVILGHSDVKITLNRYVHPTLDSKRRQMGRLPDFYGQIRGLAA